MDSESPRSARNRPQSSIAGGSRVADSDAKDAKSREKAKNFAGKHAKNSLFAGYQSDPAIDDRGPRSSPKVI